MDSIDIPRGKVLAKKYWIGDKINYGSFATVYFVKTLDEKDYSKILKIAKDNNSNEKHHTEILILKKLLGENCFPQFIEELSIAGYQCIVMSYSGECVADYLQRNPTKTFCNSNILRLTVCLFKSLHYLHHAAGYVHRDIHEGNLMLKLSNGILTFHLIDFGNGALANSTQKCNYNSISTSYNVMISHKYNPLDDFVSSMYCMSQCAGVRLFNTKNDTLIDAKAKFHRDPCKVYNSSQKWMGMVVAKLVQMQKVQSEDHKPVRMILDSAIPHCDPDSPIKFEIIDKKVVIE